MLGNTIEKSIIKVSFILSNMSGPPSQQYLDTFRKIAGQFRWYRPGTAETDDFMLDTIATSKQLSSLRMVYSEEEYNRAFIRKLKDECSVIKADSDVTARKAFVIWLSTCLADNVLSAQEKSTLDMLRSFFNATTQVGDVLELSFAVAGSLFNSISGKEKSSNEKNIPKFNLNFNGHVISDDFYAKVLDTLNTISDLSAQMEQAVPQQRKSLQQSCDILQEKLNTLIQKG